MAASPIHRFELGGRRYAIDPETCFCFECDGVSWDVLAYYPHTPINEIIAKLQDVHPVKEINEVVGELEWLRATKSILPARSPERLNKEFERTPGLTRLTVELPDAGAGETEGNGQRRGGWFRSKTVNAQAGGGAESLARVATALLLNRSGNQKDLGLTFLARGALGHPGLTAGLAGEAFRAAALAGKRLAVTVRIQDIPLEHPPEGLRGHKLSAAIQFTAPDGVEEFLALAVKGGVDGPARITQLAKQAPETAAVTAIVRPGHANFGAAPECLHAAGCPAIALDLDGAYTDDPSLDAAAMVEGLKACAIYYAGQLLQHKYFRLDPIAPLFHRIYEGRPEPRQDTAGFHELAVAADGKIYPSWRMLGWDGFAVGDAHQGTLDEEALGAYEDVGAPTTGACRRCWARNLCGGGVAAVHQVLSGSFRQPHEPWCDAQRHWMAGAVSAFNQLASQGINFTRMYQTLSSRKGPSLFTAVRAAFRMSVGMRPIQEADAPMLTRWENWRAAAYFLHTSRGLLLATKYDREMDALHPQSTAREFVLVRRGGQPIGLFRVQPDNQAGSAQAWLWLEDPEDYAAAGVRKGVRNLLAEAGAQQQIQRVTVSALARETGLAEFLESVGFTHAGTQREAVFVHNGYEDVHVYQTNLSA